MNEPANLSTPALLHRRRRVSVLIPSYNHAAYIREAVDSVLRQDWPDIELLILDDGSLDDTLSVAEQTLMSERRIRHRLMSQSNVGACVTLNRLMAMADGDVLAILNSDDVYAPGRLRAIMTRTAGMQCFFCFTGVNFIESGTTDDFSLIRDWYELLLGRISVLPSVGFALMLANVTVSTSNFVFSRDLADRSGGFDPALPLTQDWAFALSCLQLVEPVYMPESLLQYRVHPSNTWRRHDETRFAQSKAALRSYFARKEPLENPTAPSRGAWPRFFPMFLCMAPRGFNHERLLELQQELGLLGNWPRLAEAPSDAEDRAAIVRLMVAAQAKE